MALSTLSWNSWITSSFVGGTTAAILGAIQNAIASLSGWSVSASGSGWIELRPPSSGAAAEDRILLFDDTVGMQSSLMRRSSFLVSGDLGCIYGVGVGSSIDVAGLSFGPWSSGTAMKGHLFSSEGLNHDNMIVTGSNDGIAIWIFEDGQNDLSALHAGRLVADLDGSTARPWMAASGRTNAYVQAHFSASQVAATNVPLVHVSANLTSIVHGGMEFWTGTTNVEARRGTTWECDHGSRDGNQGLWMPIAIVDSANDEPCGILRQIRMGAKRSTGWATVDDATTGSVIARRVGNPGGVAVVDEVVYDQRAAA